MSKLLGTLLIVSIGLNVYLFSQLQISHVAERLPTLTPIEPLPIKLQQKTVPKPKTKTEKILSLIDDKNIELAFEQLFQTKLSPIEELEVADQLAVYIEQLISHSQLELSKQIIETYLAEYPDSLPILKQQIALEFSMGNVFYALELAFNLPFHVTEPQAEKSLLEQAKEMSLKQLKQLEANKDWYKIAQLGEHLLLQDSEFHQARLALAQAQLMLNSFTEAYDNASELLNYPQWQSPAQKLIAKIEDLSYQPQAIPLAKRGQQYIVQAQIENSQGLALLIDTGATITMLSEHAFQKVAGDIQAEYQRSVTMNTAAGAVQADIYQVYDFEISGYNLDKLLIAVNPYYDSDLDGLLGMNFLQHFQFQLDQENQTLILTPPKQP